MTRLATVLYSLGAQDTTAPLQIYAMNKGDLTALRDTRGEEHDVA
jgi:hypothetical protein